MENSLLENSAKLREGKKWKSRWCVLRKLSPIADCLHLFVYKDPPTSSGSSNKKHSKEKACIPLDNYCGVESGYQVDKEYNVLAILCIKQVVLLAFQRKDELIDWLVLLREHLGHEKLFHATLIKSPPFAKLQQCPVRLFIVNKRLTLISQIPPVLLLSWLLSDLRRFGALDHDKFCLEGGSRSGKGVGLFAFLTDYGGEIEKLLLRITSSGGTLTRRSTHTGAISSSSSKSSISSTYSPPPTLLHSPLTPGSPTTTVFPFTTHAKQPLLPNTQQVNSQYSAFGDLGVSSEVQRCLKQQINHAFIEDNTTPSAELTSRLKLSSSCDELLLDSGSTNQLVDSGIDKHEYMNATPVDSRTQSPNQSYHNIFTEAAAGSSQSSSRSISRNNSIRSTSDKRTKSSHYYHHQRSSSSHRVVHHGHSRSLPVDCDPEIYMDLSDILSKNSKKHREQAGSNNTVSSTTASVSSGIDILNKLGISRGSSKKKLASVSSEDNILDSSTTANNQAARISDYKLSSKHSSTVSNNSIDSSKHNYANEVFSDRNLQANVKVSASGTEINSPDSYDGSSHGNRSSTGSGMDLSGILKEFNLDKASYLAKPPHHFTHFHGDEKHAKSTTQQFSLPIRNTTVNRPDQRLTGVHSQQSVLASVIPKDARGKLESPSKSNSPKSAKSNSYAPQPVSSSNVYSPEPVISSIGSTTLSPIPAKSILSSLLLSASSHSSQQLLQSAIAKQQSAVARQPSTIAKQAQSANIEPTYCNIDLTPSNSGADIGCNKVYGSDPVIESPVDIGNNKVHTFHTVIESHNELEPPKLLERNLEVYKDEFWNNLNTGDKSLNVSHKYNFINNVSCRLLSVSSPNVCEVEKVKVSDLKANISELFNASNDESYHRICRWNYKIMKGNNSSKNSGNKNDAKKCKHSKSLPNFDPLQPLQFVDLSKFDGKESYLYLVKGGSNNSASQARGYDNVSNQSQNSGYANVRSLDEELSLLGYDNLPPAIPSKKGRNRNYDNLFTSSNMQCVNDNTTDQVKMKLHYENIPKTHPPARARRDSKNPAGEYENINRYTVGGGNTRHCDLSTNVPPPIPPKANPIKVGNGIANLKSVREKGGSKLPYGGTFALHGSLRRPKPLHCEVPVSHSHTGDVAGSYVMLKSGQEENGPDAGKHSNNEHIQAQKSSNQNSQRSACLTSSKSLPSACILTKAHSQAVNSLNSDDLGIVNLANSKSLPNRNSHSDLGIVNLAENRSLPSQIGSSVTRNNNIGVRNVSNNASLVNSNNVMSSLQSHDVNVDLAILEQEVRNYDPQKDNIANTLVEQQQGAGHHFHTSGGPRGPIAHQHVYGRTGPPIPLPPRRFSFNTVPPAPCVGGHSNQQPLVPSVVQSRNRLDFSQNSAFTPLDKTKRNGNGGSALNRSNSNVDYPNVGRFMRRSGSVGDVLDNDTYSSSNDFENQPLRTDEYIDMSQPLRSQGSDNTSGTNTTCDTATSDASSHYATPRPVTNIPNVYSNTPGYHSNAVRPPVGNHSNAVRNTLGTHIPILQHHSANVNTTDSPYMDMSFMVNTNANLNLGRSPLGSSTPETKNKFPNSSQVLIAKGSYSNTAVPHCDSPPLEFAPPPPCRKLFHSKSLDNELDEAYIDTDIIYAAINEPFNDDSPPRRDTVTYKSSLSMPVGESTSLFSKSISPAPHNYNSSSRDEQYLPMSTINKYMNNKSPELTVRSRRTKTISESRSELEKVFRQGTTSDEGNRSCDKIYDENDSDDGDDEKPLAPFEGLLEMPPYTGKKTSVSLSPKKVGSLSTDEKSSSSGSTRTLDLHKDEDSISTTSSAGSTGSVRRGSKGGLFARLMRRNSSAKDLGKMSSKSEEDILEVEVKCEKSTSPPDGSPNKEHIYAQIPEGGFLREPVTLPLKKKTYTHKSGSNPLLLDPVVQNERIKLLSGKVCLEHGNLTDEQKQNASLLSRERLLSERSMTPPTPPPNIPLPPPPLPPPRAAKINNENIGDFGGWAERGGLPTVNILPVPPKTYRNRPSPLQLDPSSLFRTKPEPEYVDIDDQDYPRGTGRETPATTGDPPRIVDGGSYDERPVPPPRPPSSSSNADGGFVSGEDEIANTLPLGGTYSSDRYYTEGKKSRTLPQVHRSMSLRSHRERSLFFSRKSYTEPSSPSPLIERTTGEINVPNQSPSLQATASPSSLVSVSRPRTGKEYSVVDRRRLNYVDRDGVQSSPGGAAEYLSSGQSSRSQTPVSPLPSPTKSPGAQPTVFNFDFPNGSTPKMSHFHKSSLLNQHHNSGSDTDSPHSPAVMGKQLSSGYRDRGGALSYNNSDSPQPSPGGVTMMSKPPVGFRDPDHVYMNLTFPKSPRSASPVVIDPHRTVTNIADYANIVLNYAEIDLSRSGGGSGDGIAGKNSSGSVKSEKLLRKSNIDYAMIDMVATAAASRAGKEHARHREDSLRQKELDKRYRRTESTGHDSNASNATPTKKGSKDHHNRKTGSPAVMKESKKLGRSNSAVARVTSGSGDRKHSLPA